MLNRSKVFSPVARQTAEIQKGQASLQGHHRGQYSCHSSVPLTKWMYHDELHVAQSQGMQQPGFIHCAAWRQCGQDIPLDRKSVV